MQTTRSQTQRSGIPRLLTILVALVALAVAFGLGLLVLRPPLPLIDGAAFSEAQITPNAYGDNDLATFSYTLTRNAAVSLQFTDDAGQTYVFRDAQPRIADDYSVLFGGIVGGYTLPDETILSEVDTRLMPDGDYTWTLTAVAEDGEEATATGSLAIVDSDAQLPEISGFSISPSTFTPNQDGVLDRVDIYVYVEKDANLTVYLVNENGEREYIVEQNADRQAGESGAHNFDYDGGIDAGEEPPPDGDYQVVVEAEDAVGQRVRRVSSLTVRDGGYPIAAIAPQPSGTTIYYDTLPYDEAYYTDSDTQGELIAVPEGVNAVISDGEVVIQGDMLVFRLTVTNDGSTSLRTTGPPPGTVYQQDQLASGIGWYEESGAWRIGMHCDTLGFDHPWRWAIGSMDDLEVVEEGGHTYYYLPPGEQTVVWGGVRLTDIVAQRNPQPCWFALIHEDVEIAQSNVDRRWVEIQPGPDSVE